MSKDYIKKYEHATNMYEIIGEAKLSVLVHTFYGNVRNNPIISPLFPGDWDETSRKQIQFLTQLLGGPKLFTDEHGSPQMKFRHLPFPIKREHADEWLGCMNQAMDEVQLEEPVRSYLFKLVTNVAGHMINTDD